MRRTHIPREFLEQCSPGQILSLGGDRAHYLRDVLRLRPDDPVELFDGDGLIARGCIVEIDEEVHIEVEVIRNVMDGESPIHVVLFQAIPKGKRWDWILEKTTELGVDALVPVMTERTVVEIPEDRLERRMARWEKKLAAAARQSGRTVVPTIGAPQRLEDAIGSATCDVHLVAHPTTEARMASEILAELDGEIDSLGIWIGPEGGFSDEEIKSMSDREFLSVDLGPRILRTDTAGVVAIALVQAALGDLC